MSDERFQGGISVNVPPVVAAQEHRSADPDLRLANAELRINALCERLDRAEQQISNLSGHVAQLWLWLVVSAATFSAATVMGWQTWR